MNGIQMVDLKTQYERLRHRIDPAMSEVVSSCTFIKGPALKEFETNLANYLGVKHAIGVANGTDALQIALMALDLKPGDEVIVPSFTYVATAEVIGLLGLIPVMVDVDINTYNIDISKASSLVTSKTKAIVPVHLYGQSAPMEDVLAFADKHNLFVIEDNAQAIGGDYKMSNGTPAKTGTLGDIGCTSFFPSKNLGCFGDGGALFTNDDDVAAKIRMIANHGQPQKYLHKVLGVNSRLDTLQAAVLNVKLEELDDFATRRQAVAAAYDDAFENIEHIVCQKIPAYSNHVYHQYTVRITNGQRDELQNFLKSRGVPSMIYYPIPLYKQEAFSKYHNDIPHEVTEQLCKEAISLPIHTEMESNTQDYIINSIESFFEK
ncbi:DegT/DnrJ/EryC1/StrS family aminotransferase [Bacteroidia bacterium]|nr:DegT/DnrJ/EryC1/StrS family aminotransferase [Bacteroidia bacterium]